MEFFRIVKVKVQESDIQRTLTLSNLESMSNDIFVIGDQIKEKASIGGIWGEFTLTRSEINGGLRFALAECPNALCWTVTTGFPPDPNSIVIHLTINRLQKDSSFIEEVEEFLDDHKDCLLELYS
jgi:hypothetical protein